jgi:hypothetical protein
MNNPTTEEKKHLKKANLHFRKANEIFSEVERLRGY